MSMLLVSSVNSPAEQYLAGVAILREGGSFTLFEGVRCRDPAVEASDSGVIQPLFWPIETPPGASVMARGAPNGEVTKESANLSKFARVAELADALASGASVRKDVGVQVPPRAQGTKWVDCQQPSRTGRPPSNRGPPVVSAGIFTWWLILPKSGGPPSRWLILPTLDGPPFEGSPTLVGPVGPVVTRG